MTRWINTGSLKAFVTDAATDKARPVREDEYQAALRRHRKVTLVMYAVAIVLGIVTVVSGISFWVDFSLGEGMGPS